MKRKKSFEDHDQAGGDFQSTKKRKRFSGLLFRQKITGESSIQALKSFLETYREGAAEQDIVLEYLESGGNGEEILLLLTNENKDPETVNYVFNILECIFLRVMTDLTSYLPEAEETAKSLLQSHLQAIYLLLSVKSSVESKKAVLRLLTVMSTLSGRVAKNILTYLKINNSMMYGLTRHDNSNRPLFINFVMSFIVEGNPHVVKLLLDKKDYLRNIIPGLMYDPVETVEMVLSVLQKNVLENSLINKTTKMHAFNSNVLKSFFDLFNWRGPQKVQKKGRLKKSSEVALKEVDVNEKADVQEALYPFLCVLCGSTKSGVVFFDPTLGITGKNHNLLIYKVLEALEKPWEHVMVAKLLVKIFAVCPDLISSTIHHIVPFLEPRLSQKWFEAMDFIGKVVDSAEPGIYLSKPGTLTQGQLLSALERILIPKSLLQPVVGSPFADNNAVEAVALFHPEILVRHTAVNHLNKIVKSVTRFIEYDKLELYFSSASAENQFCQSLLQHLSKALPNVASVFRIWKQALNDINSDKGMSPVSKCYSVEHPFMAADHLQAILELLLAYAKWWPPLEMQVEEDDLEDGWSFLNRQNFLKEIQQFEGLELMALELLSAIGSFTLSTDQTNKEIVQHLLHLYAKEDEKRSYSPWKQLILTLFLKTGLFEGNEVEACIWVHCYRIWYRERFKEVGEEVVNKEEDNVLACFISLSLSELINSSEHYMKVVSELFTTHIQELNDREVKSKKRILQILNDMMESDFDHNGLLGCSVNEQNCSQSTCGFTVSPLLPAALSQAKKFMGEIENAEIINNYLIMVVIHILYSQGSPKPLLHLVKGSISSFSLPKSLEKYIKSWSTQTPRHINQLLNNGSVFSQYSYWLLDGSKSSEKILSNVAKSNTAICDGLDIVLLFRMIVFHIVSLAQLGCLTEETLSMAENMLEQLIQHPSLSDDEENTFLKKSNGTWKNLYSHCLLSVFNNAIALELFEPLGGSDIPRRLVTQLVERFFHFSKYFPKNKSFSGDMHTHFKEKFLKCICDSLADISGQKKETKEWDQGILEALLSCFTLNAENVINLLKAFKNIPAATLVEPHLWNLSGPGLVMVKLMQQLCKLKMAAMKFTIDPEIFSAVVNHLTCLEEMFESSSTNGCSNALTHLEECVLDILQIFPHLISTVPKRLFLCVISSKFSRESSCKLGHFMISHNEAFSSLFLEQCDSNYSVMSFQFGRLLSYLTCVLSVRQESLPDIILNHVYEVQKEAIKNVCSSSLLELPLWISDNPQLFQVIIMKVMDDYTCFNLYNLLTANIESRSAATSSSLEVLRPLFEKLEKCSSFKLKEKPRISLMRIALQGFTNALKGVESSDNCFIDSKSKSSKTDITKFSHFMCELLKKTDDINSDSDSVTDWRVLKKCTRWKEFTHLALKIGIGQNNSLILKCLERICSEVLSVGDSDAAVLYKMTIHHSKFLEIMLENKTGKVEIMELLLMLIEKNSANLSSSLVPILLSSYGATLNKCDILIIKVLKILDHGELNFNQFSPFLWGNMAASFYSLKRKAKTAAFSAFSVLRQPKADQVLDLLDVNIVERTIIKFPIHRKLQAEDSLEVVYAETNVYDPCFYLPILSHILAPENPIKIYKVVQSGALTLTVVALGSSDHGVRGAAMHILARFYSHLETGRPSKEKKLWLNFIDSLRNGYALLANSKDLEDVSSLQLPSVVTTFLARSSLVMTDPQHVMFFPLHNYFLAKPALDLDMVPEFFRLYNSSEVESRSYRHWILEVLRDGMKSELDFQACLNNGAFKVLMTSCFSVTSDDKTKVLVLETLTAAVKTPSTAYYLVKGHGLISWIQEVILTSIFSTSKEESNLVICIIHFLSHLWFALADEKKSKLRSESKALVSSSSILMSNYVLQLFLSLMPRLLSVQLHLSDYTIYMDGLLAVAEIYSKSSKDQGDLIQEEDVKNAILLGKEVLKNVNICEDAFEFGYNVFPSSKQLLSSFDDKSIEALKFLFKFVIMWKQKERKCIKNM